MIQMIFHLDGDLEKSFSENIQKRFESYGWNYIHVADGTDIDAINTAIEQAKQSYRQTNFN